MNRLSVMGSLRISAYLKSAGKDDLLDKYKHSLLNKDEKELREKLKGIEHSKAFNKKKPKDSRILNLLSFCYNSELSLTVIELSAFLFQFPEAIEIFSYIPGNNSKGVTLRSAATILGLDVPYGCFFEMKNAYDRLIYILSYEEDSKDFSATAFSFDERLFSYIESAKLTPDPAFKTYAEYIKASKERIFVYGYHEKAAKLFSKIKFTLKYATKNEDYGNTPLQVIISGQKESGRMHIVRHVLNSLTISALRIDFSFIKEYKNPVYLIKKIVRELILTDTILVIDDITNTPETEILVREIVKECEMLGARPLIFTVRPDVKPIPYLPGNIIYEALTNPTPSQSKELWEGFLASQKVNCSNIDVDEITSKLALTPGQIKRVVSLINNQFIATGKLPSTNDIYRASYEVLDDGRYENIKRVKSGYTLSDLKVEKRTMEMLFDIRDQANHRKQVLDNWGMGEKFPYGRCISAIFAGPPGTGKTMAVHALSSELGLELYKVDLSQVVDKYVGETEKRLEEIFERAEKSNMILFFDEADAVMGKRSETSDSKDKYANTEIAYILQRIEEFDGIVILATNFLQNIDVAFMRRIRYVLYFEMPNEQIRREIWENSFSKDIPLSTDIDYDFLAEKFEISGGSIKNIILNASFYAAAENESVGMKHIIKATYRENNKDNRTRFSDDYGVFAKYIPK